MKIPTKEFLRKCQLPLMIVFATLPICIFLYAVFAPSLLPFCWAVPAAYALFTVLSFLIPGKRRLPYGIPATVLLLALGASVYQFAPSLVLLLIPVLYCTLLLWSLPMAGWDTDTELPPFWYWSGILIHIVVEIVKFCAPIFGFPPLDAISPWLLVTFFCFAGLAMLSLTRSALTEAASGRQNPSASMRRKNLVMTLVFFAIALLIAMSPAIISGVRAFFAWLKELLARLLESIRTPSDAESIAPLATQGADNGPIISAEGEPSILTKILNMVFYILGHTTVIALAAVLVWKGSKKLLQLLKKLLSNLSDYASTVSEDYEDEITNTRTAAPRRKKVRLSAADERGMPPAQRIRYRYRRLLARHPEWGRGSTARENLPGSAAPLYEKARYSSHDITEDDATRFASHTKRV